VDHGVQGTLKTTVTRCSKSVVLFAYFCVGSVATAKDKEVGKPQVSSTAGEQVSAPGRVADVVENDEDESSEADGWDDAWDDEEKWGDMEVRMLNIYHLQTFTSIFVLFTDHQRSGVVYNFAGICLSVCLPV